MSEANNLSRAADGVLIKNQIPSGQGETLAVLSRALVNKAGKVVLDASGANTPGEILTQLGGTSSTDSRLNPASASNSGIVTTGTQTLAGDKTFTGRQTLTGQPSFPSVNDALTPTNYFKHQFGLAAVTCIDVPPSQGKDFTSGSAAVDGKGFGSVRLETGTTANSVAAKYFWHWNTNTGAGLNFNNYTGIVYAGSIGYSAGSRFKIILGKMTTGEIDWGTLGTDGVAVEWECISSSVTYRWRIITRLNGVDAVGSWTNVSIDGKAQIAFFGNAGSVTFAYRSRFSTGAWTVGSTVSIAGLSVSNSTGIWVGYSNIDTTWSNVSIDKIFLIYGQNPL